VHLWKISSVVVSGNHATVRFAPDSHLKDQRQELVREPDGWKLERYVDAMVEQAPWEHCVLKLTTETASDPIWQRLGTSTLYDYTERFCSAAAHLPNYPSDKDYDRLIDAVVQSLLDDGKISSSAAAQRKAR
jgi:hypothetical protein